MQRFFCLLTGYLLGSFLPAALVARIAARKSISEVGTGNPGMANVMSSLGFIPGAAVLAGDILKTVAACLISFSLFSDIGRISMLYAGLGTCLGHVFPFWRRFRGGLGVSCTCACIVMFSPVWGMIADAAGMITVFLTGWLPLGAVIIPTVFLFLSLFLIGPEAGVLSGILLLLMLRCHRKGLARVFRGEEKPVLRLLGNNRRKGSPEI